MPHIEFVLSIAASSLLISVGCVKHRIPVTIWLRPIIHNFLMKSRRLGLLENATPSSMMNIVFLSALVLNLAPIIPVINELIASWRSSFSPDKSITITSFEKSAVVWLFIYPYAPILLRLLVLLCNDSAESLRLRIPLVFLSSAQIFLRRWIVGKLEPSFQASG